jgi:hypothetical protein
MKKVIAILGLVLMAFGLILTAFGTQQSPVSQLPANCLPYGCSVTLSGTSTCTADVCIFTLSSGQSTQPNFTLNYFGMFLGVFGSVLFASLYPKRLSTSPPINALFLRL